MRISKKSEVFRGADVDGDLVLIHAETGKFYQLKDVGLDVWQRLDTQADIDVLSQNLARDYQMDHDIVRASVIEFCDRLVELGFVEAV